MDNSNTMNVIQISCKIIIQKYYIQFQGQKMREKDLRAYIYEQPLQCIFKKANWTNLIDQQLCGEGYDTSH
jgi:hypothetical protein